MEKTFLRKTSYKIAFIVALSMNIIGTILLILLLIKDDQFTAFGLFGALTYLSLFGWFIFFIEKKGKIVISENNVTFYYKIFTKPKTKLTYNFGKGYTVNFKDIKKFTNTTRFGDGIYSADTTWYTFVLNDDSEIRFALFHFGKKQELEIKQCLDELINL